MRNRMHRFAAMAGCGLLAGGLGLSWLCIIPSEASPASTGRQSRRDARITIREAAPPGSAGRTDGATSMPHPTSAVAPIEAPSAEVIGRSIRQLNHPSPAKRQAAVKQLAIWGPLAFDALERAANGQDLESALLARDLLSDMGEVLFVGSRVEIAVDRTRARWDEPIALTIHVENPTAGQILVPWPAGTDLAASRPAEDDAHQVGAMMDVADFLTVKDPSGNDVQTRVDPIEQDTAVHRTVQARAGDHPPSHSVPADGSELLVVRQFNRGWARFPMLTRGRYTIQFAYQPRWKDPAWSEQHFGLVQSNVIAVDVTESAPPEIQQSTSSLRLVVRQEHKRLIGELQNTWDRDIWVNLNLGGAIETHARLEWHARATGQQAEPQPFELDGDATGPKFAPDRLVRLAAGEKTIVTRADVAAVLKRARSESGQSGPLAVSLRYTHIPNAQALRKALRDKGRHDSIPTQLFNGSANSEAIEIAPP